MPRFTCSYAANKRVEDGLKRKQEQIRLDYIRATHRHLDETEKLVDDLIHINVRTPSAFEGDAPLTMNGVAGTGSNSSICTVPKHAATYAHHHQALNNSQQTLDSMKDVDSLGNRAFSSGHNPSNSRPRLPKDKSLGQPIIQIRGNDVFYQYEKQRQNWKKVEPTYKTKLLLHRNNTVIKALSNFNARHDDVHEKPQSEDSNFTVQSSALKRKGSIFPDSFRRDSLFPRRDSRRDSRYSHNHTMERKASNRPVVEIPPQLSPGHTPRMLDGWTIMKWCLWNKKQLTPVWATRRYAEMKHREYQEFIASKKKSKEDQVSVKPGSAHAPSSRKEENSKESVSETNKSKLSVPRAKSVPVGKITSMVDDEVTDHFPSIDSGVIRPITSILRTNRTDSITPREEEDPSIKNTSKRRVALDNYLDDGKDFFPPNPDDHEDKESFLGQRKSSAKHVSKTVNYDGGPVTVYTWDTDPVL